MHPQRGGPTGHRPGPSHTRRRSSSNGPGRAFAGSHRHGAILMRDYPADLDVDSQSFDFAGRRPAESMLASTPIEFRHWRMSPAHPRPGPIDPDIRQIRPGQGPVDRPPSACVLSTDRGAVALRCAAGCPLLPDPTAAGWSGDALSPCLPDYGASECPHGLPDLREAPAAEGQAAADGQHYEKILSSCFDEADWLRRQAEGSYDGD